MPRYIDADEFMRKCCNDCGVKDREHFCQAHCGEKMMVEGVPTADVESVRHGRWKSCCNLMGEYFKCSECEQKVDVPTCMGEPIFDFCPYCGAKMDGGGKG